MGRFFTEPQLPQMAEEFHQVDNLCLPAVSTRCNSPPSFPALRGSRTAS